MKNLLEKLSILNSKFLFTISEKNNWKKNIPTRLQKGLEEINPDYFLVQENNIIAYFFDFSEKKIDEKIYSKIWNLKWCPIIFVIKDWVLDIFNWFNFDTEKKDFAVIEKKLKIDLLENLKIEKYSLMNLLSWKLWEDKEFDSKNKVDEELLKNLKNARKILIKDNKLDEEISTNIIWRLLFSRYLVDRWVKVKNEFQEYFEDKNEFAKLILEKEKLYKYFEYLKKTFNWDLFPVLTLEKDWVDEKKEIKKEHLEILFSLFNWDKISENKNIQKSLFNLYDFKIIPIELISEIYEQFMGEKQKKDNAFYTPSFLVDYIINKTVKKHLEKNKQCRIFDPSCGSWIFLVESLRQIIEKNKENLEKLEISKKVKKLKDIVRDNIFWVDLNRQAINVTIFSLCLTMLDYIDPKDISDKRVKFPTLLNKNLFVSNFFDLENEFNEKIKDIDFVLWNPPWKSNSEEKHLEYIENNWKDIISGKQIAQTFILRLKDFIDKNTVIWLVLPSTSILYNYEANNFRKFWLENFAIKEILDLSPVRTEIFSWAIAPTFIGFFQLSDNSEKNIVKHISIQKNIFIKKLKLLVIEKNDTKKVEQKYFLKYDYLFKTLLYWNILDFHLIKRLRENYDNINDAIEENNFIFGVWLKRKDWKKIMNTKKLIWKVFINTQKKELKSFVINSIEKWNEEYVWNLPQKKGLFEKWPKILLKKWFNKKDFWIVNCYTEKDYVFTDSLTAIIWKEKDKILLKSISAILNENDFLKYYFLHKWTASWTEREQWHNKWDRFLIPIIENKKIADLVDKIQEKYIELNNLNVLEEEKIKIWQQNLFEKENNNLEYYNKIKKEIENLEKRLNDLVLENFDFSESEKDLLDYTKEIIIPQINNEEEIFRELKINKDKKYLENYAKLYLDYFSDTWNWKNWKYFEIDIYVNKSLIWMNFKVVKIERKEKIKFTQNKDILESFENLVYLWENKITEIFYENRDIRWFNKHNFYIIKYNQKKNWHKWIWQADLSEFIWAIMKAEKEVYLK